ncbi:molybdopterin molybdotransferase MoeA [Methylobacterium sp. WL119]|uniref:molybdopterin molybdotransferase MoeA n=1 Tax=unclassified Methylobacterium TaxID=2615210 RepID=UPI0011CAD2EE|nr:MULTISPECIES: gephyrin-like molybdotransferase Glp [unclassified Methylobacterium]TXN40912.1 molybdopterin molybdotransferase MoeA [Methylobacterium sp. WL93]TXN52888.1 molybdopterin molybdotransferase MoeA [Methylobacterium sp. WL119]
MTRLSDDCFDPSVPVMTVAEATAMILSRLPVVAGVESVPLSQADGRIAAEDVSAAIDVPPFDNSAVDGYAVRFSDLSETGSTLLPVRGRLPAGAAPSALSARAADRIFTGAAMPDGADTVVMQEDVEVTPAGVVLPSGIVRGANRRPAGEDIARGSVAIPAGRRLRPQDLALAAAIGRDAIPVRRALRVAVFSTGNELTEPGGARAASGIHDSNRVMLIALLRRLGADARDLGILRDDPDVLAARLREAAQGHDLILTSGGVSVGEEDHVKNAVAAAGSLAFWRLAIKPGRPVAMGVVAGTPFVGLPGNPVAAFVTLAFVVRPLLDRLSGAVHTEPRGMPMRAAFALSRKPGRREFLRVCVHRAADGACEATLFPRRGSGTITSLTGSDGFADVPDHLGRIDPGDFLAFHAFAAMW